MRLSIIVPVLNSHEIVRRQELYFSKMDLDNVEIIYVDDGSDPPITVNGIIRLIRTNDFRPWTWALARNRGAEQSQGEYLLMTDLDYIIPESAIKDALNFNGDYMGFRRQFGVLDENGYFTQDPEILMQYGLSAERIAERGFNLPPHPNNFVIRKDLFFEMGCYREDRVGKPYPQREDGFFKGQRHKFVEQGRMKESEYRPMIYMFPNGQWCGDVDYNPFNLFHSLSRKSKDNPWYKNQLEGITR
jgi:glycosyltransferase involved in cell wall biosynthesis